MQGKHASICAKNDIFRPKIFKKETAQKKICRTRQVERYLGINLDRSVKSNFLKYMTANPHYFTAAFNMPPTPENIERAYSEVINQ